jgi:uncharacterized protein YuzB (UPF0349 family)
MNYCKIKCLLCVLLIGIISFLFAQPVGYAQSDSFILEAEQNWDTFGVGGTCISGGNNLFLGDVDDDGVIEIITGGSSYNLLPDRTTTSRDAPLRIWNWNGNKVTLELKQNWPGNINCVFASDVDCDGQVELLTSGSTRNQTGSYPSLRVWSYDGASLTLKASVEDTSTSAIFASDLDQDGTQEILTVGRFNNVSQNGARLYVWDLTDKSLAMKSSSEWCISNVTSVSSVFAQELDNDGSIEVITSGYAYDLKNSSGQLRVWDYDGTGLTLKANEEWRLIEGVYALTIAGGVQGNTAVHNVKVGDVDSDGVPEIVTVGFTYDGEDVNAQLRIWSWNGSRLVLEKSKEWMTDYVTVAQCVSLSDVDGDSRLEILTSGGVGAEGSFVNNATDPNQAQLRVWSWDGTELSLEQGKDWTINDGVYAFNVGAGDLDGDGATEIVTVGCMTTSNLCDPDLRIWSIRNAPSFPAVYAVVAVIVASAALAATFLLVKRRQH